MILLFKLSSKLITGLVFLLHTSVADGGMSRFRFVILLVFRLFGPQKLVDFKLNRWFGLVLITSGNIE